MKPVIENPEKAALRASMRQRLREVPPEDRETLSDKICDRVLRLTQWQEAQSIVLFVPLPSEPIVTPLQLDGKERGVPEVIIPQKVHSEEDLRLPETIDLILVPGLVFSKERHRLGRGGGFFDRLLAGRAKNAFKVGICFSFQLLDTIPTEPHDILMDVVVTDAG